MRLAISLIIAGALVSVSCTPKVDLTKGLQVVDVSTGWADIGVINGQNKLVPSVAFKFKNVGDQLLSTLQANVVFRRVNEDKEWGSMFVRISGAEGLAPGATSEAQRVDSQLGYTGTEPRQQMLDNTQFVDAKVQIFAKYSSTQWQLVGESVVERRLLAK